MKRKHTISMTLLKTIGKEFDEDFPSSSIKREYTYNIWHVLGVIPKHVVVHEYIMHSLSHFMIGGHQKSLVMRTLSCFHHKYNGLSWSLPNDFAYVYALDWIQGHTLSPIINDLVMAQPLHPITNVCRPTIGCNMHVGTYFTVTATR